MNPLSELLSRSKQQKIELGLLYTPAEIAQQPATWQGFGGHAGSLRCSADAPAEE